MNLLVVAAIAVEVDAVKNKDGDVTLSHGSRPPMSDAFILGPIPPGSEL